MNERLVTSLYLEFLRYSVNYSLGINGHLIPLEVHNNILLIKIAVIYC